MKTAVKRTSKEWNEIYFNYILSVISTSEEILNDYDTKADTDQERLKFVLDCFNSEYNHNKRQGLTKRIAEWFSGLPSVISIDFENYRILQLCENWGVIEKEASEKRQDILLNGWFEFIAHYLLKLAKKYKIDYSYLY